MKSVKRELLVGIAALFVLLIALLAYYFLYTRPRLIAENQINPKIDREILLDINEKAGLWFARHQKVEGNFYYSYMITTDSYRNEDNYYAQAQAIYSLAQLYKQRPSQQLGEIINKALLYWEPKLVAYQWDTALGAKDVIAVLDDELMKADIWDYDSFLRPFETAWLSLALLELEGTDLTDEFYTRFSERFEEVGTEDVVRFMGNYLGNYLYTLCNDYDDEKRALLMKALVRMYARTGDDFYRQAFADHVDYVLDNYTDTYIGVQYAVYGISAWSELSELVSDDRIGDFVLNQTDALLADQIIFGQIDNFFKNSGEDKANTIARFDTDTVTVPDTVGIGEDLTVTESLNIPLGHVSVYLSGLVGAYNEASRREESERYEVYREYILKGLLFSVYYQMPLEGEFERDVFEKVKNGFCFDFYCTSQRIDHSAFMISAIVSALDSLSDDELSTDLESIQAQLRAE